MNKMLLALAIGLASSSALAAGEHSGSHDAQAEAQPDRTLSFEAGDMWFTPGHLEVEPGETIAFEITNTGNLEHEFVIGDEKAQQAHREMMQEMGAGGHGSHGSHGGHGGHDMAEGEHGGQMPSVTIAPGETEMLVWTAPAGVESLEFACNIPGHYESGMSGEIDIQG